MYSLFLLVNFVPLLPTALSAVTDSRSYFSLVVTEPPDYVRPYVLPYLSGPALQLIDDVIRYPVNNASSGGAFSLLQLSSQNYIRSGYGDLFQAPPHYHNHSYQLNEPDTEFYAFICPDGFEDFYINISVPYNPISHAPSPPDRPQHFVEETFLAATGPKFDVFPVNHSFVYNFTNGTTNPSEPWHNGPNPLPQNSVHPYYVASNYGPKYLQPELGQVIEPIVSTNQSGGNFTLGLVTMRRKLSNETVTSHVFDVRQVFAALEGQMTIQMGGHQANIIQGDVAFVPAGTSFKYWSEVAFTKVFLGASGAGLSEALIKKSEPWKYAVFPSYIGGGQSRSTGSCEECKKSSDKDAKVAK